jgi:hypothetical protein
VTVEVNSQCESARTVLRASPTSLAHRRGCAFVARQSIESALRSALGDADSPHVKWRSRFLLLEFLEFGQPDSPLPSRRAHARQGHLLWSWWSELCHYGSYDLLPTAVEIEDRINDTAEWLADLGSKSGGI